MSTPGWTPEFLAWDAANPPQERTAIPIAATVSDLLQWHEDNSDPYNPCHVSNAIIVCQAPSKILELVPPVGNAKYVIRRDTYDDTWYALYQVPGSGKNETLLTECSLDGMPNLHISKLCCAGHWRKHGELRAQEWLTKALAVQEQRRAAVASSPSVDEPTHSLQQRLDNVNAHFRRRAAAVLTDDAARGLLDILYQDGVFDLADFNAGEHGVPLAKLTAANFCEIGANAICITDAGQRFVMSITES